ncbi:MAG: aminotransferase class I/II-fold pyridoxal phosphate-dependent enzyme [Clostridia bacterium]|jgi:arginine/lysine/ornithine decarboxylase
MKDKGIFYKLNHNTLQNSIPFHMPGHKRNTRLSYHLKKIGLKYDITEIPGYDNLYNPDGIILNIMKKAKILWKSEKSFLLVNGSTCGILAAIKTLTEPNDKILVARNCHKSVYNAIELCNLEPVFVCPDINDELGISVSINPVKVKDSLLQHPDIKMIILTSPTYEGVISDIASICITAHSMNIPVVIDEAHGAHLGLNTYFNNSAVYAKADIVIQSLHKTLPSLTQTAIAHICSKSIDSKKFQRYLFVFQTSSPSYILLSSIEGCINLLLDKKDKLYTRWINNIEYIDYKLSYLKNIKPFYHGLSKNKAYSNISSYDRSKLLLSVKDCNINGKQLFDILMNEYGIICEMYTNSYVLAMLSMCDKKSSIKKLCNALLKIDTILSHSTKQKNNPQITLPLPERIIDINTARKLETAVIPISESQERICAEFLWAYPPGVPFLIPGEKITSELISLLNDMLFNGIALQSDYNNPSGYISVLDNLRR